MILSILISSAGCGHAPSGPSFAELSAVAPPAVYVERRGVPPPDVLELGPSCPAEIGVVPTAFFHDRLLVRLPPGVEGEQVPEQSHGFARSHSPISMGCEAGLRASVLVDSQRDVGKRGLAGARERLFANLNFPDQRDIDILEGSDEGGDVSLVMSFPEHPVWGDMQVYLRMMNSSGRIHTIGFLSERRHYHRLEPLFRVSAMTMVVIPD